MYTPILYIVRVKIPQIFIHIHGYISMNTQPWIQPTMKKLIMYLLNHSSLEDKRKSWAVEKGDNKKHFVEPHIALVLRNGSVWDISFVNHFNSMNKNLLIQLPKHPKKVYFPFSTYSTILNFVREDIGTNIIQYHSDLNKQGHTTIKRSSLALSFEQETGVSSVNIQFHHKIQLGDKIWMIGYFNDGKFAMPMHALKRLSTLSIGYLYVV